MSLVLQKFIRNLFGIYFAAGVLLCGSNDRAQAVTTVDALWAWDGANLSVCQNPTSSASLSGCFGNMTGNTAPPSLVTDGTYVYGATQNQGWAYKCPISNYGDNCSTQILVGPFGGSSISISSIAASGGYLWIGQDDGAIYRCPSNMEWQGSIPSTLPAGCVLLDNAGNKTPESMVVANGWLYVGLAARNSDVGLIWRCDLTTPNACTTFDNPYTTDSHVYSLAVGAGYLWAGLENGTLWRCDLNNANSCVTWDTAGHQIEALSYDNQGGLAVGVVAKNSNNGVFWSCPTATANACATILSNKNVYYTAAGTLGSASEHFAAYAWNQRQIFNNATPYANSYQSETRAAPILYIPEGGVVTQGTVNIQVPFSGDAQRLAKFCRKKSHRVFANVSVSGPYGIKVKRRVNLCKLYDANEVRSEIEFGALDYGQYRVTVRSRSFYGQADFVLNDNNVQVVSVSLKKRRK